MHECQVLTFSSIRFKYYEALEEANSGDIRPFIRFVAQCTETSLDGYLDSLGIEKEHLKHEGGPPSDHVTFSDGEEETRDRDDVISL